MSDEAVDTTSTDTEPVIPEPAAEQVVIHSPAGDQQVAVPAETETAGEDTTDWKAKYEETLGHSRKWEARAKANGKAGEAAQPAETVEPAASEQSEPETANPDPLIIENAVLRTAAKLGADADDLLDSRRLMADLEALDQSADDYADQVATAIKAAVDARPSLAGKPARAGKSGNPVGGGATTGIELDPAKLAAPSTSGPKVRLY